MTLEEAINTAIEYEKKVRDLYAEFLKKIKDEIGKRIFKVLVREEQQHVDYLKEHKKELLSTGHITADIINTEIPSRSRLEKGIKMLEKEMKNADHSDEIQLLEKALKMEIETSDYYKKLVSELPEEGRKFFSRFVEIENGHVALVQAELDYLNNTGYWFDYLEIDLDGA